MAGDHLGPRSLRQLLDAVMAIGSELDLDQALREIVEAAALLVDARYGALGVLDEARRGLAEFITVGIDAETRRAIGPLPKGLGVLGALITDARPLRVPSLEDHPDRAGFPPNHPQMTSFLGVPIVSHGEVFGNLYLTDKTSAEVFSDLDEQLVSGLAAAAGIVIHNARLFGRVQRRDAALTALHQIVAALGTDSEGRETLQLVAERAGELVDADVATIALPATGGESLVIEVVAGTAPAELRGQQFPINSSVSGEVIRTGRPVVLVDAAHDHRVGQPQVSSGTIGPAIWVPLTAYGQAVGTLSVGRLVGAAPFTDGELELVQLFAAQAGVVLEIDSSRARVRRLSVLEDQERIARDLHDTVIQRLFATGLSLQAASRLATEPLAARIMSAVDDLDTTIRHIRTAIFGLEHSAADRVVGLRSRILDLCAQAAATLGFDPKVGFQGPIDTMITGTVAPEVLAVLGEALSNVGRHATANTVEVDVSVDNDHITLTVTDDGHGLGATAGRPGGHGLDNMRARAARLDGDFELGPAPTSTGVRLCWSVPLP